MNGFDRERPREAYERMSVVVPAVESFSDPEKTAEFWPNSIAGDREFREQLKERKDLNERLDAVMARLPRPDVSLDEALAQGLLTEKQIADLYSSLSSLLEASDDYDRLVLYLPFEFLPGGEASPSSSELKNETERFKAAYMDAWAKLLSVRDVRANFVDGNILDMESRVGDLPRVVKAAHLIPKLVEKGFLNVDDVLDLYEANDNETLKRSIAETLPVLADMNLIDDRTMARLEASRDPLLIVKKTVINTPAESAGYEDVFGEAGITMPAVEERLNTDFRRIDGAEYGHVTAKRKAWLQQDAKQKAVEAIAAQIAEKVAANPPDVGSLRDFASPDAAPEGQIALVEGLRIAMETAANADTHTAQSLYEEYLDTFMSLWANDAPGVRDALSKAFCRLNALRLADAEQLRSLGVKIPKLAGPFSENMNLIGQEMNSVREMVALIENNPLLAKSLYPVALVFGSRLKGYGRDTADVDLAVIVKPGTAPAEAQAIREAIAASAAYKNTHGEIVEFWLEQDGEELRVIDEGVPGDYIGGSSWTHVLFGAAWEGEQETIKELRTKLLAPYLIDKGETIEGRQALSVYLEEMERDTLQYRLMHKGYERFMPAYGGINTAHAGEIDGKSAFWDSGYRLTATKLFANRVFLPQIKK